MPLTPAQVAAKISASGPGTDRKKLLSEITILAAGAATNLGVVADAQIQKALDTVANSGPGESDGRILGILAILMRGIFETTVGGSGGGPNFSSGATAPVNGDGDVGDWYLDSVLLILYEKTGPATWTKRGQLVPV